MPEIELHGELFAKAVSSDGKIMLALVENGDLMKTYTISKEGITETGISPMEKSPVVETIRRILEVSGDDGDENQVTFFDDTFLDFLEDEDLQYLFPDMSLRASYEWLKLRTVEVW